MTVSMILGLLASGRSYDKTLARGHAYSQQRSSPGNPGRSPARRARSSKEARA
ncbi:MAG: hypothetical protein MJD61_00115 [Proteobacteria bacterium]|nr:hypothetical protein [Pseudomonadota bacterium]